MNTYVVKQIILTEDDVYLINTQGSNATERTQAFTDVFSAGKVPANTEHYTNAFQVLAESLNDVFAKLNNPMTDGSDYVKLNDRARSASVGDIIVDLNTGEMNFVKFVGFEKM